MAKEDIIYIHHIFDAIKWIEKYFQDINTYKDFSEDHLIQDGVIRQ